MNDRSTERTEKISERFRSLKKLFDDDQRDRETLMLAIALWKRWPDWKGVIETSETEGANRLRRDLSAAVLSCIRWLIREGVRSGVDAAPIAKSQSLVCELILSPGNMPFDLNRGHDGWPDFLGSKIHEYSEPIQQGIIDSQAAFELLAAVLEVNQAELPETFVKLSQIQIMVEDAGHKKPHKNTLTDLLGEPDRIDGSGNGTRLYSWPRVYPILAVEYVGIDDSPKKK